MFTSIAMNNLESEVMLALRPVLLACVHRGFEAKEALSVLEEVDRSITWNVKICFLYQGGSGICQELSVEGTPTYLLYVDGEEVGRFLGKATPGEIIKFVSEKLSTEIGDLEQKTLPFFS